jgi:hypothetical protein
MVEQNVDAVPTIDEVYNIFKTALAADQAVLLGKTIDFIF